MRTIALASFLTALSSTPAFAGPFSYRVVPLFADNLHQELRINSGGAVVGTITPNGISSAQAVLAENGIVTPLGFLPGYSASVGLDIAADGTIVGFAFDPGKPERAFVYSGGTMQSLQDLGGTLGGLRSIANRINDNDVIVGWSNPPSSGASRGFLFDGTSVVDLGTLGGAHAFPRAVNDSGEVAGISSLPNGDEHAALFANGTVVDIGTFGGQYSYGFDLNDAGQVVGAAFFPGFSQEHAFMYDGVLHDLGTLGGTYSRATAINSSGLIVGDSHPFDGPVNGLFDGPGRAVLVDGGIMWDLNLLALPSGYTLVEAWDINDAGQIAAIGCRTPDDCAAVRLDPVPEPGSMALVGTGAIAFASRRWRSRRGTVRPLQRSKEQR